MNQKKKNIPRILPKLTDMVDFELKIYHTDFCETKSKVGGAMDFQSGVIFEKIRFFVIFFS